MRIDHDFRSIFAEILQGAMELAVDQVPVVFPGLTPKPVGLFA